jgi:tripartite-type tricarboxylate transporter receptor subunit TctC
MSLASAFTLAGATAAQLYPTKPIRLIVGSSAGGGGDTFARVVSQALSGSINQQVIIDNRAGAGGNIGADLAAKAPSDGYTLLFVFTGHVLNPSLYARLPFDTVRDFVPVTMLATNESVLAVHASLPAKSVAELVAPARTPAAIVTLLNQRLVQVLKSPDFIERMTAMGNEPVGSTPAEFDKFIRDEIPKWAKVIKEAKITLAP